MRAWMRMPIGADRSMWIERHRQRSPLPYQMSLVGVFLRGRFGRRRGGRPSVRVDAVAM
jgi:hypothetical protein